MVKKTDSVEVTATVTDETPELNEENFDLDAWIEGVESTVRSVPIRQRADLVGQIEELEYRLRIAEQIPASDRGLGDESPDTIKRQLVELAEQFEQATVVFKLQGRAWEWVDAEKKRLKKAGVDEADAELHMIAACVTYPKGVTPAMLRKLGERNQPELNKLKVAFAMAIYQPSDSAQAVTAPLSQAPSEGRKTRGR